MPVQIKKATLAAKPTKRESTSPAEMVRSAAAPVLTGNSPIVAPASDTTGDPVVVVDALVVSDEVEVAVVVAEAVNAEPVDAGVATVAFAEIGAVANTEDRNAEASERADDAADGMAAAVLP